MYYYNSNPNAEAIMNAREILAKNVQEQIRIFKGTNICFTANTPRARATRFKHWLKDLQTIAAYEVPQQ